MLIYPRPGRVLGALLVAASITAAPAVHAFSDEDIERCDNRQLAPDVRIKSCTAVISSGDLSGHSLAVALGLRADAYSDKGNHARAITDYNEAIRADKTYAAAYLNRGLTHHRMKNYDRAIADFGEALQVKPGYASAFAARASVYDDLMDYDQAIADYGEAIRYRADYALAFNNRGFVYYKTKDFDRAIADFNDALRIIPKYSMALNNRGLAYAGKLEHDRAIADYSQARSSSTRSLRRPSITAGTRTSIRGITIGPSPTTRRRSELIPRRRVHFMAGHARIRPKAMRPKPAQISINRSRSTQLSSVHSSSV